MITNNDNKTAFYLRPTTCKCVHLVMHGHFRSRDKDGSHTIRSNIADNPMLHANSMSLCFTELELLPFRVLHCGNRDIQPFLLLWLWHDSRTFIYELTRIPGTYTRYANMNSPHQGCLKFSSDRQTRINLYTTPLCGCSTTYVFLSCH